MNKADCEALGEHYVKTVNTVINSLSDNPTKWSNMLNQFVSNELFECV